MDNTLDRNSLFRAVSYSTHNTTERYSKIRSRTVNKVINDWKHYKKIIVSLLMVSNDYKILPSRHKEYVRSVKLTCISCLFSNYVLRVHYQNSMEMNTNTVDYFTGSIVCQLLFSGNYGSNV